MKMSLSYSLLSACVVGLSGAIASAEIITVNFGGTITQILNNPYPNAAVGDTFSGSFSYESSTPATGGSEQTSEYLSGALLSMNVTLQTSVGPLVLTADILEGPIAAIGNPKAGHKVSNDEPDIFDPSMLLDSFRTVAGIIDTNSAIYVEAGSRSTLDLGLLSSQDLPESLDFSRCNNEFTTGFQINSVGFNVAIGVLSSLAVAGTPNCEADFNTLNGVTVQDIFDFLTAWLAGSSSADFNSVNGVTVQDIFDFLTAWLAGC